MVFVATATTGCDRSAVDQTQTKPEGMPVRVQRIERAADDGETQTVTGTVRAKREIALSFKLTGIVDTVEVQEGQTVHRGQRLASLTPNQFRASRDAAAASFAQAQSNFRRIARLQGKGWVTQADLETAQQALTSTRSQLASAQFDLLHATLFASADGVVLRRTVEPGQTVVAGEQVLIIADDQQGYVLRAPVADRQLGAIKRGQMAAVRVSALDPPEIAGRISQIGARSDDRTSMFEVEIALPSKQGLRSGLIGEARIMTPSSDSNAMMLVPASALVDGRADEAFVFVMSPKTHTVTHRLLNIARLTDSGALVAGGLNPGDLVVVEGADSLRDNQRVTVLGQGG